MKKLLNQTSFYILILLFSSTSLYKSQVDFTVTTNVCAGSSQTLTAQVGTLSVLAYSWAVLPVGPVFSNPGGSVTGISFPAAGNYTIGLGALYSSGYSYTTQVVNVYPLPVIGITQSSATTCIASNFPMFSKPIHLVASGASTYTWSPLSVNTSSAAIDVRPSANTCYTVIGSAAGCEGMASICVSVVPQFSIEVSPNPALRCIPDSALLTITVNDTNAVGPSSAFTYSWTEGTSQITLSSYFSSTTKAFPLTTSSYTAEVFDSRDCVSFPKVVSVDVQNCTGIKAQTSSFNDIRFYPNPVSDKLFFDSPASINQLHVFNALGQKVYSQTSLAKSGSMDMRSFPAGVYYLNYTRSSETKSIRVVKVD